LKVKITTEEMRAKDIKPGDLFTTAPQEYWDHVDKDLDAIAQTVYIRTGAPCPKSQEKVRVYKVIVTKYAENLQEMGLDLFERKEIINNAKN
jgi:hypothetical protein